MADFSDTLNKNLVLRKKEITTLLTEAENESLQTKNNHHIRVFQVMLYSHWEGFIKFASQEYIKKVANSNCNYSFLNNNLKAFHLDFTYLNSKKGLHYLRVLQFINNADNDFLKESIKENISTQSNLTTEVFKKITTQLGISDLNIDLYKGLIDKTLLNNRNSIAHGGLGNYWSISDAKTYTNKIITLLDSFSECLIENFENNRFLQEKSYSNLTLKFAATKITSILI